MDSQDRGFSQFLHTAASYIPDSSAPATPTETEAALEGHGKKHPSSSTSLEGHGKKPPSASEALSSAKIILDAAESKLHKAESESGGDQELDKAKVAAAAGDVLAAAKHYGKLDENKQGGYLQKAEDYLHKYGEEHRTSTGNSSVHNSMPHTASHNSTPQASSHSASEDEKNEYGKYLKQAGDLFNKF